MWHPHRPAGKSLGLFENAADIVALGGHPMATIALRPEQVRHARIAQFQHGPGKIAVGGIDHKRVIIDNPVRRDMGRQVGAGGVEH